MPDYDFSTLSPLDFEQLVNDLVQAREGTRVQRFGPGPDGGMDGRFASLEGQGIVQAKHYRASSFSQLKASLIRSRKQMLQLGPRRYLVCTSQSLSPSRKDELAEAMSPLAMTAADVWAREDLNALLGEFPQVEKSHIKLWLNSAGVLESLLNAESGTRTDAILSELQRATRLFVGHDGYVRAQKVIDNQKLLIVAGPPGVGKTTLALVMAARYLEDNWEIVAINSIGEALKNFSTQRKQVFYFDDFLGAIKLNRDALSKDDSDFRRFTELVRRHSQSTRFLLTTRGYIYEEARIASETLSDEGLRLSDVVIDLNSYSKDIKSQILYNHLFFSDLPQEHLASLVRSGFLTQIIEHKNYMPRVIEWLTEEFRLSGCTADDYPAYFLKTLDRPDRIWRQAVQEHLDPQARLLLLSIYFMPSHFGLDRTFVRWFEAAVMKLSSRQNFILRESEFKRCMRVLEGSFVQIKSRSVSYVNPSLRDYVNARLLDSPTLEVLADAVQTRTQAITIWRFIKSEKAIDQAHLSRLFRCLAERCLIKEPEAQGYVSLYDFINFADDIAETLGDRSRFNIILTEKILNSLDLDMQELPKLFEEIDCNIYQLPDPADFRKYLKNRFISELQDTNFDLDDGVALLMSAEEHPNYLEESELEALGEMADGVISGASLPSYDSAEGDWETLSEQLEVLERWGSDRQVRYLRSEVEDYLAAAENYRQEQQDQSEEEYRLYGRRQFAPRVAASPVRDQTGINQVGEVHYREVFGSLLSPETE